MRLRLFARSVLTTGTAIARVVLTSGVTVGICDVNRELGATVAKDAALLGGEPVTGVSTADTEWDKAVLSGGNLWAGMQSVDRKASFLFRTDPHAHDPLLQSIQSEQDGDMKELWEKWGYNEDEEENAKIDKGCDFEVYHKLKRAFDELGIKTQSKGNGGPNHCVQVDHKDGPKVIRDKDGKLPPLDQQKYIDESCGKEYRVSLQDARFSAVLTANVDHCGYVPVWS
jgi:hypothetical protein